MGASRVAVICDMFGPTHHVRGDRATSRVGVMLTEAVKQRMRVDTQRVLRLRHLKFYHNFSSRTPNCKSDIVQQLNNYRVEWKQAKDNFGRNKFTLTGKRYAKNDDLAICLQYLCYYPSHFYAQQHLRITHAAADPLGAFPAGAV